MEQAVRTASSFWDAEEVVRIYPSGDVTTLFLRWIGEHHLGRKRLLDTMLAATYCVHHITSIVTLNRSDFTALGGFRVLSP